MSTILAPRPEQLEDTDAGQYTVSNEGVSVGKRKKVTEKTAEVPDSQPEQQPIRYRDVVTYVTIPAHTQRIRKMDADGIIRGHDVKIKQWICRVVLPDTQVLVEDLKKMVLSIKEEIPQDNDILIFAQGRRYSRMSWRLAAGSVDDDDGMWEERNVTIHLVNWRYKTMTIKEVKMPIRFNEQPFDDTLPGDVLSRPTTSYDAGDYHH